MKLNVYAAAVAAVLLLACVQAPASASGWWLKWDGGADEQCFSVAMDGSGNSIAVGFYHPSGNNIWRVAKYGTTGTLQWEQTSGPSWGSQATDVATDPSGNIYVCGYYPGTGGGDWKVVKYNSGGDTLWERDFYAGAGNDAAQAIATDPSGNAIVAGITNSSGNNQWTVLKLSASGDSVWALTEGPSWGSDAQDVATDASGNIYVCGYYPGTGGSDWKVIKYDAGGSLVREASIDTANVFGPGDEAAYGIAVRQGYCSVAGVCGSAASHDWALWHYDTDNLGVAAGTPTRGPRPLASVTCSPNPFARQTQISYSLPNEADVILEVCNSAGRVITTLADGRQSAGRYTVPWDVSRVPRSALPSGTYFCRLEAGGYTATRKMVKSE